MKVRASRLASVDGTPLTKSDYMTLGREYVVLAVQAFVAPKVPSVKVLLLTDVGGRSVGLFNLADFEITEGRISSYWRTTFEADLLHIQHERWAAPGFWEAFDDELPVAQVPDARERFDNGIRELLAEAGAVVILFRPTGPNELKLVEQSGWLAWPPRLPEQPIFYPVLTEEYARKIAKDWNAAKADTGYRGYVTRFTVRADFLYGREVQTVGASWAKEYWIPAEDLDALNGAIVGPIEVIATYEGGPDNEPVERAPHVSLRHAD
jgi:hypothetical protein